MFYSQFILAKKGPLGTIWIAAHLERKLRKNQVADTDIGVSVDSILFPDVPIALRLSSHLLLGVVRIYSKKVNYLFHDCSETLLKIKQAFRSTAVDLPPEESTAPYHSITLPETFDLDDFELPDNGLFEGNFVDHHISSREQITLQDTLNGMSYSTSQFGPDERFGDGDASQIGLDIDESLFADKVQTPMDITDNLALEEHEGDSFLAAPATTLSEMDIDGPLVHDDMQNNSVLADPNDALPTEPIEAVINGVEITCRVRSPSSEFAQAPSTPGLLQEAIPATYHDGPTLSPLRKLSPSNVVEGVGCDDGEISHLGDDPDSRKCENLSNSLPESVSCADQNDMRHDSNLAESEKGIRNNVEENSESLESPNRGSDTKDIPLDGEGHPEDLREGLNDGPPESITQVIDSAVQSTNDGEIAEGMEVGNSSCHMLLPCSSGLKETDVPHRGDDELVRAFDSDNVPMDKQEEPKCLATESNTNLESPNPGESTINAGIDKLDDTVKDNHLETLDCETSPNIQLPESFVSAPPSALVTPNVMVPLHEVEVTTETEKDDESLVPLSGLKRKVMETAPTLQNGDLAQLSELPRSKKSADFIPDDDDVLASILVGRKTPSLKLKPTPPQEGATTSKRTRINPRASQSKRKVLVDDAMVMHGDVIRQQLIHTEDIRRVRRKAPCSQIEIWMIENSHLEEEMFTEPLFSGVSSELCSVASQIYKVIETEVLKSGETTLEACVQQDVSLVGISDRNNEAAQEPSVLSSHTEKQKEDCNGGPLLLSTQEDQIRVTDSFVLSENENGLSLDHTGAVIDVQDLGNADNAERVDPEMDNISGPLNGKVLAEMPEVVTDLDVEKLEARADMVPNSGEEKTECAHVDEPMNDASVVINEKVEVPYDGSELSLVQEVCNGGTSVETSSGVDVPKDVENENDHTQHVPMEVDLSENLVNVEETFKESEPPTLPCPNQCEMDSGMESLDRSEVQIQEVEGKDEMEGQIPADTVTDNLSPLEEIHTEFLNLDDEVEAEPVEEEDNYASTEQDRFFENSGWSSRTRAVARYLKSLFDNEDGRGRKVVAVDNLLAGKTRKEASRMFFETLVLKTKDYIQVQQDNSFGNINIKPRGKLVKSDF